MYHLVTLPTAEPLVLPEIKTALRISHDEEDVLLAEILATARTYLERRLDMAFLQQTWKAVVTLPPSGRIPLRPMNVLEVLSVDVISHNESVHNMENDTWHLSDVVLGEINICPAGISSVRQVEVTFTAGYAAAEFIPDDLLRALYLLTAHYYEERELFRERRYVQVPKSVEALIEAYREMRV